MRSGHFNSSQVDRNERKVTQANDAQSDTILQINTYEQEKYSWYANLKWLKNIPLEYLTLCLKSEFSVT